MNLKFFTSLLPFIAFLWIITGCEKNAGGIPQMVQDIDGNSYPVIALGEQLWMAENLQTTRFRDGTNIPLVTDNGDWALLLTPGYCWFNNDENNKQAYGALYNWYAVNSCKICPEGWHVPSDEEWTELEIYLQNNGFIFDGFIDSDQSRKTNNRIGKAMCSATGWEYYTEEGSIGNTDYPEYQNLTGLNVLPAGYRDGKGEFMYLNRSGNLWSSTEKSSTIGWYRRFVHTSLKVIRDDHLKVDGFSVRCIKDKNTE